MRGVFRGTGFCPQNGAGDHRLPSNACFEAGNEDFGRNGQWRAIRNYSKKEYTPTPSTDAQHRRPAPTPSTDARHRRPAPRRTGGPRGLRPRPAPTPSTDAWAAPTWDRWFPHIRGKPSFLGDPWVFIKIDNEKTQTPAEVWNS